ncbi:Protein kinase-like domain [Cordyceps militaris CM01]|uniref:Protein kinase-like domain n=1 Tax=Cordyceps militaris (strain CM01) TaxID=983644 RepID=G3JNK8_CORMM|nr:Protein kinase-like domain [Cordyceps militaris CM01]EGX89848.1 Protein kinase-like domain [Cordyceps militaris CM01]
MEVDREYRIYSYTTTNPGEEPASFLLRLRLDGKFFSVEVSESLFRNSPARLSEFHQYLSFLQFDEGGPEDDDDGPESHGSRHAQPGISIDDCFEWTVQPLLETFKELAPEPALASRIMLDAFFSSVSYECRLGAVDERLDPGPIDALPTEPPFIPDNLSPGATTIEVLSDAPSRIRDHDPTTVRVHGAEYFFKSLEAVGEDLGRMEIRKYEDIAKARFGPAVRTSRLFGIAQDAQRAVKGIMLHRIAEQGTLDSLVRPETPRETRQRWSRQIQQTLGALHDRDIVWGDAKAANVLIDVEGDAWIIDFGGGYTRGWVDEDGAGTIAGDLEGLQNIIRFINAEE